MTAVHNALGQPVGHDLSAWTARPRPTRQVLKGAHCRLEPLEVRHAADLHAAYVQASGPEDWTYLSVGPFDSEDSYRAYVAGASIGDDPLHFAVIDAATERAVGTLALMRVDPNNGVIEVGFVTFSPLLKRSTLSTEAQYLFMRHAFDTLGYRRYEWKCDALNAPSRKAAERMGFTFEGVFRNAVVYKGRNRDTAWFSITAEEWPAVRTGFERWLSPENFDEQGRQRLGLADQRKHGVTAVASEKADVRPEKPAPALAHTEASLTSTARIRIATLTPDDRAAWLPLWHGYQAFYKVALGDAVDTETWQRLMDAHEPMFALGAFGADDELLGIVHGVLHRSTWTHGPYLYLQDLFTVPAARGQGIGRSLIEAIYARGQAEGAGRVYWLTHESNHDARMLYDRIADNKGYIQYRKDLP